MARAPRPCPTPGCPRLTAGGRCDQCRRTADKVRGTSTQRGYNSAGHQRFRTAVLDRDPICVECELAASTVADHHPYSRRDLIDLGLDPDDPTRGRGVCKRCHDKSTGRLQPGGWNKVASSQGVTVVSGPPLAGKTTYVRQHKADGDLVVDWDALAVALGSPVGHGHSDSLVPFIASARDAVLDRLRRGYDGHAWVITTETKADALPAHTRRVHIDITADEAHERCDSAGRPHTYHDVIDAWFASHPSYTGSPHPVDKPVDKGGTPCG